ncbi:MAG TPA: BrnT family toxin [Candidatus Binataceae bacterium]|jgi:hypothetical protein
MVFQWDPGKNAANVAKHAVSFQDAIRIFQGPVLEMRDLRRDYGEERIIAIGMLEDLALTVVYAVRGESRRIISARRAHHRERKAYRAANPK